ncbi:aspartate/glutamate/uridylate kinase [Azospirillum sp. RWY-5-1]|uniref:Aspartate/glutamate/uridylate kinase n=1 Tax=Azospirillum oleiclasticum TaxID=2735135 RepID=A0ABX2TGI6_9PROT|nr:aspartate/glutamate/uridylate kinase [Azospirillum oleiclasticum]NYZ14491.1 aspartate/glutamate/uridylate kinase [Azospirillum oleiclasticum]NYZ23157.1 aspartate/glutamate/uridylate kinase [Azospirillum oleiclasticum]
MSAAPRWVVKLGGSLWEAPELRLWLDALASARGVRVVVVPGGGPFADTVRAAQPRLGFGDRAAHVMALLAMEQYGTALADLEPRLVTARTRAELDGAVGPAVWLPTPLAADADVAESWDVTSDSLAVWLAQTLDAEAAVLVKSAPLAGEPTSAEAMAAAGVVDPALPGWVDRFRGSVWCVDRDDHRRVAEAMGGGSPVGTRLTGAVHA